MNIHTHVNGELIQNIGSNSTCRRLIFTLFLHFLHLISESSQNVGADCMPMRNTGLSCSRRMPVHEVSIAEYFFRQGLTDGLGSRTARFSGCF